MNSAEISHRKLFNDGLKSIPNRTSQIAGLLGAHYFSQPEILYQDEFCKLSPAPFYGIRPFTPEENPLIFADFDRPGEKYLKLGLIKDKIKI